VGCWEAGCLGMEGSERGQGINGEQGCGSEGEGQGAGNRAVTLPVDSLRHPWKSHPMSASTTLAILREWSDGMNSADQLLDAPSSSCEQTSQKREQDASGMKRDERDSWEACPTSL